MRLDPAPVGVASGGGYLTPTARRSGRRRQAEVTPDVSFVVALARGNVYCVSVLAATPHRLARLQAFDLILIKAGVGTVTRLAADSHAPSFAWLKPERRARRRAAAGRGGQWEGSSSDNALTEPPCLEPVEPGGTLKGKGRELLKIR